MKQIAANPVALVGGVPITPTQGFFKVNGHPVNRLGDLVLPHGTHIASSMASASFVKCNGVQVCHLGDLASCGHSQDTGEFVLIKP